MLKIASLAVFCDDVAIVDSPIEVSEGEDIGMVNRF